jgi:SAM-dependent methyltransferase
VIRNSREDWSRYQAAAIPTKSDLSFLESWLAGLEARKPARTLLDVGCGAGKVSRRLGELGFAVVGVDINAEAIDEARRTAPGAFYRRDVALPGGLELEEAPFDVVVCQLVLSIVGTPADRRALLRNAHEVLAPRGHVYLSASGVSSAINPTYRRLYQEDFATTGERHTYDSRDASGNVLYRTHHFTEEELRGLLDEAGFETIEISSRIETSSRRPDEAALFLYAFARSSAAASK